MASRSSGVELALRDRALEVARDPRDARPRRARGPARRAVTSLADRRVDLGDAVAHQAGAGDEHALDRSRAASSARGRPGRPVGGRVRVSVVAPRRRRGAVGRRRRSGAVVSRSTEPLDEDAPGAGPPPGAPGVARSRPRRRRRDAGRARRGAPGRRRPVIAVVTSTSGRLGAGRSGSAVLARDRRRRASRGAARRSAGRPAGRPC